MQELILKDSLELHREEATFHIGFGAIKGDLISLKSQLQLLHIKELEKFGSFKFERRKHSYLLGRLSAKQAIQSINDKQESAKLLIGEGIFNFPVIKNLKGDHLQLSISHCEDIGITLAYPEEHPMGIDIELINDKNSEALESVVNDSELAIIKGLPISKSEGLAAMWTIKEALSKILRTGLMMDFSNFEVSEMMNEGSYYISKYKNAGQYRAITFLEYPFIVSIAIPGKSDIDTKYLRNILQEILKRD